MIASLKMEDRISDGASKVDPFCPNEKSADDDSDVELSADVLAMVREVQCKQATKENDIDSTVAEDWGLSQFWYTEESVKALVEEVLAVVSNLTPNVRIACLSCPSLFRGLLKAENCFITFHPYLFEYDTRFRVGNEDHFAFWDYAHPRSIPDELKKQFDLVIADPPHLAESCILSYSIAIRELSCDNARVMFCTGAIMGQMVSRCLGCRETTFKPQHESKLGNEFGCFTNYQPQTFQWTTEYPKSELETTAQETGRT